MRIFLKIMTIAMCLLCARSVFAVDVGKKYGVTITPITKSSGYITVMSDSVLVEKSIDKRRLKKSIKPGKNRKPTSEKYKASLRPNKNLIAKTARKKSSEPEIIQLEVPEQLQKIVNTTKGFVLRDVTQRENVAVSSNDDLTKRKRAIELLRQAVVKR